MSRLDSEDALERSLESLVELGRAGRRIDSGTATRIATEAARIAAGSQSVAETAGHHDEQESALPPPIGVASLPRPREQRRWYPAAAAAVILIASVGYTLAVGSDESTITQGGTVRAEDEASAAASTNPEPASTADPVDSVSESRLPAEGADPTTTSAAESVGDSVLPEPGGEPTPAITPSSGDTTSTSGTVSTSTPPDTASSTTAHTLSTDGIPITVGGAGMVALRFDRDSASVADVVSSPGWTHNVEPVGNGGVTVSFVNGGERANLRVEFVEIAVGGDDDDDDDDDEAGGVTTVVRMLLEPESTHRSPFTSSRVFDFGDAGRVDVSYNADGISHLEVTAERGWSPVIQTLSSSQLDIRLAGTDDGDTVRYELRTGSVTITMRAHI